MGHRAFFLKLIADIRASYWFLPALLAFSALVLARLTLALDQNPDILPFSLPDNWKKTQSEGARTSLAVIAQSMIAVAGVMFSMTIVAVSFASGNFGPRLVGNFMRDRGNQWSLGILISTFVYALSVLGSVQSASGEGGDIVAWVPHYSLYTAVALALISVLTMIYLVHHIPEIINVANITNGLGRRLNSALRTIIDARRDAEMEYADAPEFPSGKHDREFSLAGCGYIQTWNSGLLHKIADENQLFLEMRMQAGDFVTPYTPVVHCWGGAELPDDFEAQLSECFALGPSPTETQNVLFIIEQLVEMIARALSPGVNDPFTAINCINWIYSGLSVAANYNGGLQDKHDSRLRTRTLTFDTLLKAGIERAMPYTNSDTLASKHLAETLKRLASEIEHAGFRRSVKAMARQAGKAIAT